MTPIRLTPAQLDAALESPRARCASVHGDARCTLERGHAGRHRGPIGAAGYADWHNRAKSSHAY